jgi:hypothetical protein
MKSKTRRLLESWQAGKEQMPTYIADGQAFIFPSDSGESTHHVVVRVIRRTPKRQYTEFLCSCRGFAFSHDDICRHVNTLKREYVAAMISLLNGEGSGKDS